MDYLLEYANFNENLCNFRSERGKIRIIIYTLATI